MIETVVLRSRHFTETGGERAGRVPVQCLVLLLLAAAGLGACGEQRAEDSAARVEVKAPGEGGLVLPHGGRAVLDTVWHPLGSLDGAASTGSEPVVFVHLLDGSGAVLRTFDHPFPGPWPPEEPVRHGIEVWHSVLAPPLEAGRYRLTLGLVEAERGRRWPLRFDRIEPEAVDRGEYVVATVAVPSERPPWAPEVAFTGAWRAPDELPDRQVIRTRMLAGEGAVVLRGFDRPLAVEMVLHVPRSEESGYRLVLDEGADGAGEPAVTVTSPCASGPERLVGRGSHRARLVLRPPADGGTCPVRIAPEFVLVDPVSFDRITVQLRRLTWEAPAPEGAEGSGSSAGTADPAP